MRPFFFAFLSLYSISEGCNIFWFTGLPCSGKTTIAKHICATHPEILHLDGDEMRKILSADLGFSLEDRTQNLKRIASYALSKKEENPAILVTTISPLQAQRETIRELFEKEGVSFFVVYIDTSLQTCIQRDVKGMYAQALNGKIAQFTGISSPYEPPVMADLTFRTDTQTLEEISTSFEKFYEKVKNF